MRFGMIGLGRMGANITRHAMEKGHQVVGFDPFEEAREAVARDGMDPVASMKELAEKLEPPRVAFTYVPHGEITERVTGELRPLLDEGDVVVDGGNSNWQDSQRRHQAFAERGIRFLDMGTSGGIEGARAGACFMVGGDPEAFGLIRPILEDLALNPDAVIHAGDAGSGHFVKMIHNAIEFGMIQSIAEGVEMLMRSGFRLDLPGLFRTWNNGSVIRSWLVELMGSQLQEHAGEWDDLSTYVEDTGEVKWVVNWATERDIPAPVITMAQQALMQYRDLEWPQAKAHALLRNAFGGHPVHRVGDPLTPGTPPPGRAGG